MRILSTALLGLALVSGLSAQAKYSPVTTDRPDFTESSTLVPKGRVQFESGITVTESSRNSGAGRSTTYPELLVRYGLSSRFELRVAQSFTTRSAAAGIGSSFTARDDLYLGLKFGLGAQRAGRPELAVMVQATVPTGDKRISESSTFPGVALLASWELAPEWSLAVGVQANAVTGDAYELGPSLSLGRALSSRLTAYAELYSLLPVLSESGAPTPHYFNGGLSLLLSDDTQIDARAGAGLTNSTDRYFIGLGFAIRP